MTWLGNHWGQVFSLVGHHIYLAALPLLVGLVIALPLGWVARRWGPAYPAVVTISGLLYTIPSLALFILMPLLIGTKILDPLNVVVAMTVYTVALLARTVADGLGAVPDSVRQSARAMGFKGLRTFLVVELPLAVPVIAAGLRVAAVSNVSIVSVASLIGVSQLGDLLVDGFNRTITGELLTGIIACVILALLFDAAIQLAAWFFTPWRRVQAART